MRRAHRMPFGAEVRGDGTTAFRLWAPAARRVELVHDGTRTSLRRGEGGWFAAVVADAPAGTRYAFSVDDASPVPDPASRSNPEDVHAASEVVDPRAYDWRDEGWRGRPWHEAVLYELHVGAFTPEGRFASAIERLDHLVELGVTAVEIMPVADFPGARNWGYDGVLLFAPDARYGTPDDMKRFVDAAHGHGLMVLLDVVYNHFGPEGNYLHGYAPAFFDSAQHTPWGAAIDFDGAHSRTVRDFYVHNALYWLTEFNLDGLRFDAVHAIVDTSTPDIISEITRTIRATLPPQRPVHLVLENDRNEASYLARTDELAPREATAQWNDDAHHALHVAITGETDGYYADYADVPVAKLARALAEGFAYQDDWSGFREEKRGEASAHLPPLAFVNFLQNHDQVGNRAFGERITAIAPAEAVAAAVACVLLSPAPPLLFMGEEFGASTPFLFFCDFGADLATAVRDGRRDEFARFGRFADVAIRERIPDPNACATFEASRLDWAQCTQEPHRAWLAFYRRCLAVRRELLVPRLAAAPGGGGEYVVHDERVLAVTWRLGGGATWQLVANLSPRAAPCPPLRAEPVFALVDRCGAGMLAGWDVRAGLDRAGS